MPTQKLNTAILLAAIEGFEQQKLRIDVQIAELRAMLSGGDYGTGCHVGNTDYEAPTDECRRPEAHS